MPKIRVLYAKKYTGLKKHTTTNISYVPWPIWSPWPIGPLWQPWLINRFIKKMKAEFALITWSITIIFRSARTSCTTFDWPTRPYARISSPPSPCLSPPPPFPSSPLLSRYPWSVVTPVTPVVVVVVDVVVAVVVNFVCVVVDVVSVLVVFDVFVNYFVLSLLLLTLLLLSLFSILPLL